MAEKTNKSANKAKMSLFSYLSSEVTRGYVLDHDEERYTTRRQKMYTFMKIPRELEKFMSYGFFHCLDSFLFVFTFLPIRFVLALIALIVRAPLVSLGLIRPFHGRLLFPAEKIDLLKGLIIGICAYVMSHIDTSMMYHLIKSQSVIKLYLFYNMLEVGDRLFSAFGQDTIDALFWTATEPTLRKREHIGVIPHFLLTITYVVLHTLLVLLQATTLNVAINASNKALLTIMMSNNFVELKGSVFKKFDKNNLFQVSCSDVRERFHLFALLFIVVVQTMKEYGWREESFWSLAPDCLLVMSAEFLVDWIKHAFITRFNEVPAEVYKDYTTYLAYDLAQTKQKHAFSDHSDIVSRRMGFIPLPLGVVMIRVITNAVRGNSRGAPVICILAYFCLVTFRILASIVILGKACDLIDTHQETKPSSASPVKNSDKVGKNKKQKPTLETAEEIETLKLSKPEVIEDQEEDFDQSNKNFDHSNILPETSTFHNISVNNHSVFYEGTSPFFLSSCPPFGGIEKLDSISKSSSVILEEEEEPGNESSSRQRSLHTESSVSDDGEEGLSTNSSVTNHRWSNSRSSKFLVARGELKKSVYSDSRRRPLSCTPPRSTSLSTSASVEDEDEIVIALQHQHPVQKDQFNSEEQNQNLNLDRVTSEGDFTSKACTTTTTTISSTTSTTVASTTTVNTSTSTFLPDLLQLGQQQHNQEKVSVEPRAAAPTVINNSDEKDLETDLPPVDFINNVVPTAGEEKSATSRETNHCDSFLSSSSIGPRSMSSPDFLHQYQRQYDEERDWPLIEREEDEVDGAGNEQQQPLKLSQDPNGLQQSIVDDQFLFKSVSATSRRGSSSATEDNRQIVRNRKRFDTDRL